MKISFKRALSAALAVVMIALMIPTGFAVTATAADADSSVLRDKFSSRIITEENADYVFTINGTDDKANGYFKTLEDAIMKAREAVSKTYYMKVLIDLTPIAKDSSGTGINFSINFSMTLDGSKAATKPVITLGKSAAASFWLCAGNGSTSPMVTFKNVDFDFTNLKKSDGATANAFDMRGGTILFDNCVMAHPTAGTLFNNISGTTTGNLVCVDTKIVSNLSTLSAATKECVYFSNTTAEKPMNIYAENCTFDNSNGYSIYTGLGSIVEIYGGTYKSTKSEGYALSFKADSIIKIEDGTVVAAKQAIWTGERCQLTIDGGNFTSSASDCITVGASSAVEITGGSFESANGNAVTTGSNSATVITGGSFKATVSSKYCVNCNVDSTLDIYGGTFEANGNDSQTIAVTDNLTSGEGKINTSTEGADRTNNVHRTGAYSTARIYGGTFVNNGSGSFVIRPYKGGVAYIYGGTFVSKSATVFGTGESSSSGYIYIYGGDFIGATSSAKVMNDNNDISKAFKYYYIYGGNYYSAGTTLAYRSGASNVTNTMYNRMHDYVTYTDLDAKGKQTTVGGYTATWADACTISLKKDSAVYGGDVFGKAFKQTTATAGCTGEQKLRVLFEVDKNADFDEIIFWVSKSDASAMPLANASGAVTNGVAITADSPVTTIYGTVKANGVDVATATENYGWAILEIDGIGEADYATNLYVRAVAVNKTTGEYVYSTLATASVSSAIAGN